jgi:hypothetical protein
MGKIKKYQPGGKVMRKTTKGPLDLSEAEKSIIRRQTRMPRNLNPINRLKKDTVPVDLSAPGKEMMEQLKKKGSMPASQKNIGRKGIKVKKAKGGASLKPVPADRQKSLGKLPTAVRNKMGYQKNGGKMKKARGGATLSPTTSSVSKRLGSSKRLRGGGTLAPTKSSTSRRLSSAHTRKAMGGMKMGKCKYGC